MKKPNHVYRSFIFSSIMLAFINACYLTDASLAGFRIFIWVWGIKYIALSLLFIPMAVGLKQLMLGILASNILLILISGVTVHYLSAPVYILVPEVIIILVPMIWQRVYQPELRDANEQTTNNHTHVKIRKPEFIGLQNQSL